MIKPSAAALLLSIMSLSSFANASPRWGIACANANNSAAYCSDLPEVVAKLIVSAENLGFRFDDRRVEISFSPWNPRADAVGTPVGTLHLSDGRVSCSQSLVGYLRSGPLTCH